MCITFSSVTAYVNEFHTCNCNADGWQWVERGVGNHIWECWQNAQSEEISFHALCMVAEEVLRPIVQEDGVCSFSDLITLLDQCTSHSWTTKLWRDNYITPVIIMMSFSQTAHEGDWVLHMSAAESMLPYFHSAGCHNYAQYVQFACNFQNVIFQAKICF